LTTRPSLTSRQGITRVFSIALAYCLDEVVLASGAANGKRRRLGHREGQGRKQRCRCQPRARTAHDFGPGGCAVGHQDAGDLKLQLDESNGATRVDKHHAAPVDQAGRSRTSPLHNQLLAGTDEHIARRISAPKGTASDQNGFARGPRQGCGTDLGRRDTAERLHACHICDPSHQHRITGTQSLYQLWPKQRVDQNASSQRQI
jgi:hypothetical protein